MHDFLTDLLIFFLLDAVIIGLGSAIILRKQLRQAWYEYKAEKTLLKVQTELFDR